MSSLPNACLLHYGSVTPSSCWKILGSNSSLVQSNTYYTSVSFLARRALSKTSWHSLFPIIMCPSDATYLVLPTLHIGDCIINMYLRVPWGNTHDRSIRIRVQHICHRIPGVVFKCIRCPWMCVPCSSKLW